MRLLADHDGDDQVVLVVGEGGDDASGAVESGLIEHYRVGGIAGDAERFTKFSVLLFLKTLDGLFIAVNKDVRRTGLVQFLHGVPASITQPANDEMIFEFTDPLLHGTSPEKI